jgi:hypothetical protein
LKPFFIIYTFSAKKTILYIIIRFKIRIFRFIPLDNLFAKLHYWELPDWANAGKYEKFTFPGIPAAEEAALLIEMAFTTPIMTMMTICKPKVSKQIHALITYQNGNHN